MFLSDSIDYTFAFSSDVNTCDFFFTPVRNIVDTVLERYFSFF